MSAVSTETDSTSETGSDAVMVGIDDLIIGRPIGFPIVDEKGVLLLAEGSLITSDFKRLLRQHKVQQVAIDRRDAGRITLSDSVNNAAAFSFDNEITRRLDSIIEGGMMPVMNRGPAVKDGMTFLGCKAYDADHRERLLDENSANQQAISGMIKQALHGGSVDGATVSTIAGGYLKHMQTDTDNVLSSVLGDAGSDYLSVQALQTSLLSMAIGIELGLDADNVRLLGLTGLVHDWGMMRIPEELRTRSTPLDSIGFHEIKKHPIYSLEMLQSATSMPGIVSLVAYQIHERPNGTGYPRGRSGNAIHQFARIVAVADIYTALTMEQSWRPPIMAYAALECLLKDAQRKSVDPQVVRALLSVLSLFPIGSLVTLSDGSVARVLRRNGNRYMTPIVHRLQDSQGEDTDPLDADNILDLATSSLKIEQALPTPGRHELGLQAALRTHLEESFQCA